MRRNRYSKPPASKRKTFSLSRKLKRLTLYSILAFVSFSAICVAVLRILPAPTSAFMLKRHIDDWRAGNGYQIIDYQWRERRNISKHVFAAVIAAEDQRFYTHHGFDFEELSRAVEHFLDGGRLRGASTISQQVAKNLFLTPEKSFWRKGLEVWFTLLIETLWDKRRILEMYVNVAEFGDHVFGIEAASRRYFKIPATKLTARQAALLAAILPNPIKYKASQPSEYIFKRQAWILRQMKNLGYLS